MTLEYDGWDRIPIYVLHGKKSETETDHERT